MKKNFLFLSIFAFFFLILVSILFKIRHYDYNLSSLVGIWEGFRDLNPDYIPPGFVVFREGGYDGQFFFMLAQYLYHYDSLPFPVLDSFFFRFHRLGLSLLTGSLAKILGIEHYPAITLLVLVGFHLLSFRVLHNALHPENRILSLFFLFSPYSLLGIQLLVSDPLLVSLSMIACYALFIFHRNLGFSLGLSSFLNALVAIISASLALLVRETSLFVFLPLLVFLLVQKQYRTAALLLPAFLSYTVFLAISQYIPVTEPGTNPLKFLDMIDWPLLGFWKSLEFSGTSNPAQWVRDSVKFFLFLIYIQLGLNSINIYYSWVHRRTDVFRMILFLFPVLCSFGVITIAEQGYWRSFDNLSRMFTLALPSIILAKNSFPEYRDFGFLKTSLVLTAFLVIRSIAITKPMSYTIQ